MTLKIAFLISGQARNFIYTTFSFKKYVFDNCKNADIFISFKENSRIFYSNEEINKEIIESYKIPIDDRIKDQVYLKFMFGEKLKYFDYDDEIYIKNLINNKLISLKETIKSKIQMSVLDQYARVKNIAEIFEKYSRDNNINYDIIIRLRLDKLWWVSNIDIENFLVDKTKLYFSYIEWKKSKYNNLPNWIQDYYFMGEKNLMLYVMKNFFENLYNSEEFIDEDNHNSSPEVQLGHYVNSDNYLKTKVIVSTIRFNLYALLVNRPLYLKGYFVGNKKDVYKALEKYLQIKMSKTLSN